MLPAGNRLTSSDSIKRIQRSGTCKRGTLMTLCYVNAPETRFAVVVGQKTSRSAVTRTRVKRQIRGALSHAMKSMSRSVDGVVMSRAAIVSANPQEIHSELSKLLGS